MKLKRSKKWFMEQIVKEATLIVIAEGQQKKKNALLVKAKAKAGGK